jgi:hypothetical protein
MEIKRCCGFWCSKGYKIEGREGNGQREYQIRHQFGRDWLMFFLQHKTFLYLELRILLLSLSVSHILICLIQ